MATGINNMITQARLGNTEAIRDLVSLIANGNLVGYGEKIADALVSWYRWREATPEQKQLIWSVKDNVAYTITVYDEAVEIGAYDEDGDWITFGWGEGGSHDEDVKLFQHPPTTVNPALPLYIRTALAGDFRSLNYLVELAQKSDCYELGDKRLVIVVLERIFCSPAATPQEKRLIWPVFNSEYMPLFIIKTLIDLEEQSLYVKYYAKKENREIGVPDYRWASEKANEYQYRWITNEWLDKPPTQEGFRWHGSDWHRYRMNVIS